VEGICAEVLYPSGLSDELATEARTVAESVADLVGAVGVLAVELFVTPDGVVLNEVATRPHNSGHWTIEGAATSQFANHVRAVAGSRALGEASPVAPACVMVNVIGADTPLRPTPAASDGVACHHYAKAWRPAQTRPRHRPGATTWPRRRVRAWETALRVGARDLREDG
jgi:5-(carboxyamino)imidazole ribonucleotide synthase